VCVSDREEFRVSLRPPVIHVPVGIELAALVVVAVRNLVSDHSSDA
jgi:hypothetical protein